MQIPVKVLQVAWLLTSIIEIHREGHPALVQEIMNTRPGTLRDLQADRVDHGALADLCVNFGIMANMLAQQQAANQLVHISEQDEGSH